MADLNKVDPLSTTSRIGHAGSVDVTPSSFLVRQWQLIRAFVNGVGTNLTALVAAVARIDATTITGVGALGGGGAIGSGNLQITHDNSAVTPGVYGDATHVAQVTVDAQGHVTAAAAVAIAAAGGTWALFQTITPTVSANIDITGLAGKTDVLLIFSGVTKNTSANALVQLSVDNGVSFFAGASDYQVSAYNTATGLPTPAAGLFLQTTASTTAIHQQVSLQGLNLSGVPKAIATQLRMGIFSASLLPVNAIRISTGGLQQFNGGTIYVLAR